MSIAIINGISLGLGTVPIITRLGNLQEFERGRIHYLDESFSRIMLLYFTKNFLNSTLCRNSQKLFSFKSTLVILTVPSILTFIKSSYASHYINPKVINLATRIEKLIGKICYMSALINAVALVNFGHLIAGYTALAILALDLTTSFTPILRLFPQTCKMRIIFTKYISPFATLVNGLAIRSYVTSLFSILGIRSLWQVQCKTDKKAETLHRLKYSEFMDFLSKIQSEGCMLFEMNRERVPLIKIPALDPTRYNPNKLLELFDAINWDNKQIQKLLCERVRDIPQPSEKDWPQVKRTAQTWLKNVLNAPEPELLLFKQHICKMLLENQELLKSKTQTTQSLNLFKGLLTFIFGSGGECRIAQSMKIKEGFLEIYKSCNKVHQTQNNLLLLLEIQYKNITEQAFKDVLGPTFKHTFKFFSDFASLALEAHKICFTKEWEGRFSQIPILVSFVFNYLQMLHLNWSLEQLSKHIDLNNMHNFSRTAKIFGEVFNIASDMDEVAERTLSTLLMDPLLSKALPFINKALLLTTGRFYWNTQLEKIIPLLKHYFRNDTLELNNLLSWFNELLEGFKSSEQLNQQDLIEINAIQEELQQEPPKIHGLPIIEKYEYIRNKMVPIPSDKTLILFAYCINLLKPTDERNPFNNLNQNLETLELGVNIELEIQPMIKSMEAFFPFLPKGIRNSLEEYLKDIENPKNIDDIGRLLKELQDIITKNISKEILFFTG